VYFTERADVLSFIHFVLLLAKLVWCAQFSEHVLFCILACFLDFAYGQISIFIREGNVVYYVLTIYFH